MLADLLGLHPTTAVNWTHQVAASLRQVQDCLERIIPALEAIPAREEPGDDQS